MGISGELSYKHTHRKTLKTMGKMFGVIIIIMILLFAAAYAALVFYLTHSAEKSKKRYDDISEYARYRSGENALDNFKIRGMKEIWPEEITADVDVQDYLMMYYNPWDANYLGYLVIEYSEADYEAEILRLQEYPSTDYIGCYGATGFESCDVLAMESGDDGFVYAITDRKNNIIYVELVFPGYGMDIEYEKYIPQKYLPQGLDAAKRNPVQQKVIENNERKRKR